MNTPFPLGFPLPTAFYETLLVLTLVVHVVFMNYVLAGAAYLAFVHVVPVHGGASGGWARGPVAAVLRDWMPFAISAAITAGVAPLLFLQVLFKERFYTANLLLFNRWMAILPVLIVGFYMAYLFKSKRLSRWPVAGQAAIGLGMLLCLGFVAYSWTENHLLSLESRAVWAEFYGSGRIIYRNPQILPRLGIWVAGAFPTMAVMVAWQLWGAERPAKRGAGGTGSSLPVDDAPEVARPGVAQAQGTGSAVPMQGMEGRSERPGVARAQGTGSQAASATRGLIRTLALMGIGGLVLGAASGVVYLLVPNAQGVAGTSVLGVVTGAAALPYLVVALAGWVGQLVTWGTMLRQREWCAIHLGVISAFCLLTILGATAVREVVRVSAIDMPALYAQHAAATRVGGLTVFLAFAAINAGLIAWCFVLVKRGGVEKQET